MLQYHLKMSQEEQKRLSKKIMIKCNHCSKKYNGFYGFSRHISAIHDVTGVKPEDVFPNGYPYKCPDCSSKFTDPHILKGHRLKVHNYRYHYVKDEDQECAVQSEKNLICHHCNAKFAKKTILLKHLKWFHLSTGRVGSHKFRCKKCFAMFSFRSERDEHQGACIVVNQCCQCQKMFSSTELVRQHFDVKHPKPVEVIPVNKKRIHRCPLCLKMFLKKTYLVDHFKIKDFEEPKVKRRYNFCDDCGELVSTDITLHKLKVHRDNFERFYCKVVSCRSVFTAKDQLLEHMKIKHATDENEEKPFTCKMCEASYTAFHSLSTHMQKEHNLTISIEDVCPDGLLPYKCKYCSKSYSAPKELNAHMKSERCRRTLKCCQCQQNFCHERELRLHFDTLHKQQSLASDKNKLKIECNYCHRWFKTNKGYKLHIDDPTFIERRKRYMVRNRKQCDECEKEFDGFTQLDAHKMSAHNHEKVYDFVCKDCGKAFGSNFALRRHCHKSHPAEPMM